MDGVEVQDQIRAVAQDRTLQGPRTAKNVQNAVEEIG